MKVLGKTTNGYICEVSHTEIEKCYNKFCNGGVEQLRTGDSCDLGAGYNFRDAIASVGRETTGAIKSFERYMPLLTQFMALVGKLPPADATTGEGEGK